MHDLILIRNDILGMKGIKVAQRMWENSEESFGVKTWAWIPMNVKQMAALVDYETWRLTKNLRLAHEKAWNIVWTELRGNENLPRGRRGRCLEKAFREYEKRFGKVPSGVVPDRILF